MRGIETKQKRAKIKNGERERNDESEDKLDEILTEKPEPNEN